MAKPHKTLGIILSGGAGKRIGDRDKGLVVLRGKPMVEHVIERLAPQVDEIVVCIHRNRDRYLKLHPNLVMDESIEFEGPMAGIYAALKRYQLTSALDTFSGIVVSPCDVPKLWHDYVGSLQQRLNSSGAQCVVAHDGYRRQNLHCLFTPSAVSSLMSFYDQGGRAMHRWFEQVQTVEADMSDQADGFSNINTQADLDGLIDH